MHTMLGSGTAHVNMHIGILVYGDEGSSIWIRFLSHSVIVYVSQQTHSGLILGLPPTNEGRRYKVTPSLIGWAQT